MKLRKRNRATTPTQLATLPMFNECARRDLHLIDRAGTRVDVEAGDVLCRQGDLGRECFIVLSGHAHVTIDDQRVSTVGRGAFVGEVALLSPSSRRVATVVAQSPMSLFVIGRREFSDLVRVTPGLSRRLVYAISERLTDDLTRIQTNRFRSSPTFAAGRHWGDDPRSISAPAITLLDTDRPRH